MLGLFPWNVDPEIRGQIRTGGVVYELLRPVDLYFLWFARSVARRTAPTALRAVPMFIIAISFLGLPPPPSAGAFLAWQGRSSEFAACSGKARWSQITLMMVR